MNPYPYKKNNKIGNGFTLIELVIVTLLIAVLSGVLLGVLNIGGLRAKARDNQRIADLEKIQSGLELYLSDNRNYPPSSGGGWENISAVSPNSLETALVSDYINSIPTDPSSSSISSSPCSNPNVQRYNYVSDGSRYMLAAMMEEAGSADMSKCEDLPNAAAGALCAEEMCCSSYGTSGYCYGVQNP
jgi:prepilin-type N-terminal cleavage/methylation domain-containing protein